MSVEPVEVLVARRAVDRPDALAVRTEERWLSYRELDRAADRVVAGLRERGAGRGDLVGVVLPRGVDLVIAQLGVLRTGGAFVAVDPDQPPARRRAILDACRPVAVLADPDGDPATLSVADLGGTRPRPAEPECPADPADLAYVVHTSGSTGEPKGVMVERRGLANLVAWHHRVFQPGPGDRTTMVAAPAFDASVWEIWAAVTAGATLEVPPAGIIASPDALQAWLVERRITTTFLPTPVAEALLAPGRRWPEQTALRTVLTGGDRLHPVTGAGPFTLVNNYGPTENTVVATSGPVRAGPTPPSIGWPVDGVTVLVLDERLRPVPTGRIGELYLGGVGLARGYLDRPAATAARFVAHPFAATGERVYRTGDLVRRRDDGGLDFVGRGDDQMQVRGVRVEPGEVESALCAVPGVHAAAVALDGDQLTAYLVLAPPDPGRPGLDPAAVRAHLSRAVPRHMRPHRYALLPALPLTAHGKVDRRALATHATVWEPGSTTYADESLSATTTEAVVSRLWADALGHADFGPDDNFFDVGGSSLLLAVIRDRLEQHLGCPLPIVELFEHPTAAALARRLDPPTAHPAATPHPDRTDGRATTRRRGSGRMAALRGHREPAPRPVDPERRNR